MTVSDKTSGWVTVGQIVRPRGTRGEVLLEPLTSRPERLRELSQADVVLATGVRQQVRIASAWQHGTRWVLEVEGFDTIEKAERLRNAELQVPMEDRVELDEGEYFYTDLVGCEVIDRPTGESLGKITGWQEYGGPGLLEVGKDLAIPFVRSICSRIDLGERKIWVDLPEGLRELNREGSGR